ncbi:sulfatase-like hydrolase/transferase [Novipirellula sp. SH528]|uniref:sulfatase-like hydrolase/transferase n=1 Tax=Novipirellula sp. SH528 TaxID=3454466 RepID=UPI003F9FFCB9
MKSNRIQWLFFFVAIAPQCFAVQRPNILFCIADDASLEHFGADGCTWVNTPNIDRIAKEGINFTSAYTPNPKCSPSRSVIITGRNPSTGFKDTDPGPTMTAIVEAGEDSKYWKLALGKRGAEELYDVEKDPECITDLSENPEYAQQMAALKKELFEQLTQQGDLRMTGDGDWYDGSENPYFTESERDFYQRMSEGKIGKNRSAAYLRPDLEDGM